MNKIVMVLTLVLGVLSISQVYAESYVGFSGGYSLITKYEFKNKAANSSLKEVTFENSPSISGRVGMRLQNGLRTELGFGWQNYDVSDILSLSNESGDVDLYEYTVSFIYDFSETENVSGLKPFIGIGGGVVNAVGDVSYSNNNGTTIITDSFNEWAPALIAQAGFNYEISEKADFVVNYSALIFPDDTVRVENTVVQNSINVGINFNF